VRRSNIGFAVTLASYSTGKIWFCQAMHIVVLESDPSCAIFVKTHTSAILVYILYAVCIFHTILSCTYRCIWYVPYMYSTNYEYSICNVNSIINIITRTCWRKISKQSLTLIIYAKKQKINSKTLSRIEQFVKPNKRQPD